MGRLWQAAGTVQTVLRPGLLEKAVDAGLRSLFVGFETVNAGNLTEQRKWQNVDRDYAAVIRRLHDLGVMVNGSFVFGMDEDDASVFDRTVEWAVGEGMETATFHILTPYPGARLYERMSEAGRILHHDWDRYDTREVVFEPARLTARELEEGVPARVPRRLPVGLDPARRPYPAHAARQGAPRGVRGRLEEVRAALGPGDPGEKGRARPARPGVDPVRIRRPAR